MITTVPMLTEGECKGIRDRIYELRKFWIQRHVFLPFFTLGAASYLDTSERSPADGYYPGAKIHNIVLRENFGWLYERLNETLTRTLEAPVFPQEGFALPGFHLFLSEKLFEDDTLALSHFDQQYDRLVWENPDGMDFTNPVSFTLAISMPEFGAGMYVWDLWLEETADLSDEQIAELRSARTRTYHQYTVGHLFVHSGHFQHQIAPYINTQPGDERFTLQGHAVRGPDGWHYYW